MHVTRHWSHVTTCCKDSAARPAPVTVAPIARICKTCENTQYVSTHISTVYTYLHIYCLHICCPAARAVIWINPPHSAGPHQGWGNLTCYCCSVQWGNKNPNTLQSIHLEILNWKPCHNNIFLVCKIRPFSHFSELFWVITIYRSGDTRQVPGQLLYVAFIMHLCHNSTRNIREMSKYKTLFHSYNPNISGNVPPH